MKIENLHELVPVQPDLSSTTLIYYVIGESMNYQAAIEVPIKMEPDGTISEQDKEKILQAQKRLKEMCPQYEGRMGMGCAENFAAFSRGYPELGQVTPDTQVFRVE